MDTLKFIEERNRMCNYYGAAEYITAVEQWSKEHPRKTRQDVFLEQYPEAWVDEDGCLRICPNGISPWHRSEDGECITSDKCADCRREFWMQEVE